MEIKTFTLRQIQADPSLTAGLVFLSQDSQAKTVSYRVPDSPVVAPKKLQEKPQPAELLDPEIVTTPSEPKKAAPKAKKK